MPFKYRWLHHSEGVALYSGLGGSGATEYSSPAYLFVGVLSCSSFVYAELCRDMKSENFILCHVHAYEYFGGVTRLLVPDNLKAGVTKNTRYET